MSVKSRDCRLERDRSRSATLSAIAAAVLLSFSFNVQSGKIVSIPSAGGAAGFGGWNLANVELELSGTGSFYTEIDGDYGFSADSDFTYMGQVDDGAGTTMGYTLGKDWPVGEPSGIKVINDDFAVKAPKPTNCIMTTSYLEDHYLDDPSPQQVLCSGPYQSHKRYKVAMLPATIDGIESESVDLVFNVIPEEGERRYQVFQKINNWTDARLNGFTVEVGFGVGTAFKNASDYGLSIENLNLTIPAEIWSADQLATFSSGLFGPEDVHTGERGFFDPDRRAGFVIDEYDPVAPKQTTSLHATTTLGSNYGEVPEGAAMANQFGNWLPNSMLPYGIFFDEDGNPQTDALLLAWYGYNPRLTVPGFGWMGGSQDVDGPFAAKSEADILEMGENLSYTMDLIDDLVNVGLNYIVTVGDVSTFPDQSTFTIRVTPSKEEVNISAPDYVGEEPDPPLLFRSEVAKVLLEPKDVFEVGSLLTARVGDANKNLEPDKAENLEVRIYTDDDMSEQVLTLVEQGENRGVFVASLPEEFSLVAPGTTVTMAYLDETSGEDILSSSLALQVVSIIDFAVPEVVMNGQSKLLKIVIQNDVNAFAPVSGNIVVSGSDGSEFMSEFSDLLPGKKLATRFKWFATLADPEVAETVNWVATVLIGNNELASQTAVTEVLVKVGKNLK